MEINIEREYNEKTGESTVVVESPYGVSIGKAQLKEKDARLESPRTGIIIAELKALIKNEHKRYMLAIDSDEVQDALDQREAYEQELIHFKKGKEDFRKKYYKLHNLTE